MSSTSILDKYEILTPLVPDAEVYLVMDRDTGEILIEKITNICDNELYQLMIEKNFSRIPKIHEMSRQDGKTILIEDYIHGRNLMQHLKEHGVLSEEEVVSYMVQVCEILHQFHSMSPPIIHRDIKPENIMLSNEFNIYIIDFNISREYKPLSELDTVAMVSYHFSAPELYGFGQSDHRSDIYSIGATMHYLLTGGYLKETKYDGPLSTIISRCTALDPDDRYQSVTELKEALLKHQASIDHEGKEKKSLMKMIMTGAPDHKDDGFMIPGFRSRRIWKMILAVLGYIFITWLCFTLDIKSEVRQPYVIIDVWLERISVFIFFILSVFISCNYRGWMDRVPLINKIKLKPLRIVLSITILMFIILFALTLTISFLME